MSLHEKERNKKMPTSLIHKVTHNPIPASLTCCLFVINAQGKAQHLGIQLPAYCDLEETKM